MMEEEKNVDNEKKKKSDVTRFKHMNFSDSVSIKVSFAVFVTRFVDDT